MRRQRFVECEICDRSTIVIRDHDHDTGEKRGWLCIPCNNRLRQNRWESFPLELQVKAANYLANVDLFSALANELHEHEGNTMLPLNRL